MTTAKPNPRCAWDCPVPCALHNGEAAIEIDALGLLLDAVKKGAVLELIGPQEQPEPTAEWPDRPLRCFTGRLQSGNGERHVAAASQALGACVVELAKQWTAASIPLGEMHDHRCSRLRGAATCNCGQGGKPKEIGQ